MRKPRVVVFDDDVSVLKFFEFWLGDSGYEVLSFKLPKVCPSFQNNEKCKREHLCADIIVTDYRMPRMNGVELLQSYSEVGCKTDKRNKAVISGYLDDCKIDEIKKLGYSFFKKPIDMNEFWGWLSECEKRINLSIPLGNLKLP